MTDLVDVALNQLLLRGASWRVDRVSKDDDVERWAIVVSDEEHRKVGTYAHRAFTSRDATNEWLQGFFRRAFPEAARCARGQPQRRSEVVREALELSVTLRAKRGKCTAPRC